MGFWFVAKLYIPFHSGRNGRKISYRFEVTPHSTLYQISGCFGAFQPISGEMDISADSRRDGHFGRYTFWGNFFFFCFSLLTSVPLILSLRFSLLSTSLISLPPAAASQLSLRRLAGHSSLSSPALSPSLQPLFRLWAHCLPPSHNHFLSQPLKFGQKLTSKNISLSLGWWSWEIVEHLGLNWGKDRAIFVSNFCDPLSVFVVIMFLLLWLWLLWLWLWLNFIYEL